MNHRLVVTRLKIFALYVWPCTEKNLLIIALSSHCCSHLLEPEGKVILAAIYHVGVVGTSSITWESAKNA